MDQFSRDQWFFGFFFNTPCLTCQPEVLNYVRCTELCTKLCALLNYVLNYVLCIQIAFQLLNPFPMQKIRTKRAYHLDIVKVRRWIMVVYLGRCVASLAIFNSECSESDRKCSY